MTLYEVKIKRKVWMTEEASLVVEANSEEEAKAMADDILETTSDQDDFSWIAMAEDGAEEATVETVEAIADEHDEDIIFEGF